MNPYCVYLSDHFSYFLDIVFIKRLNDLKNIAKITYNHNSYKSTTESTKLLIAHISRPSNVVKTTKIYKNKQVFASTNAISLDHIAGDFK